jgi:hypothetical protein
MAWFVISIAHADLTNGLVAYYPFNGNADDESGNGYNGTVSNVLSATDRFGVPGGAFWYNGTNSFIDLGNPAAFNFAGDFTISVWIMANTTQIDTYVVGKYYYQRPHAYGVGSDDVGGMYAFAANTPQPSGGRPEIRATIDLADGRWHHLVAVFERQISLRGYVDGTEIGFDTQITNHIEVLTNEYPLLIGKISSGNSFQGSIDDVRIYNRALSAPEVQQLYEFESGPRVIFVKAFTLDYRGLTLGSNYQLQVSADLNTWTNYGTPFMATGVNYTNTDYQRIQDWGRLFFRLQIQ